MKGRRNLAADVSIVYDKSESEGIRKGLNLIAANNLINTGDVVVITPNWVQMQEPATGVVVGTESLKTIIEFVKKLNPRRIVVATGSGERPTSEIMQAIGFDKVIQKEGVEFIDINKGPFTKLALNHNSPSSTNLNKLYEEMTFLISFTQLKIHSEATISASLKNVALGWPPAEEHGYPKKDRGIHQDLHGFIRAMSEIIPTDLSIVSCNPAMIGTGPSGGKPVHTGLVLCGTDSVAVDTLCAHLLGFKAQAVHYLYDCINKGLGTSDFNNINFKGMSLIEAEEIFSKAVYNLPMAIDRK